MSKLKLKTLFTSACLLCLTQFGFNVEAGSRYVLDLPRAIVGDGATVEVKGEPAQMLVAGSAGDVRMWSYNGYWNGSQYYRPKDIIFDSLKSQRFDSNHTGSLYFQGYSDNSANFRVYASSDKSNWREVINVGNVKGTSYVTKSITFTPSSLGTFRYIRAKLDSYTGTYGATIDSFRLSVQQVDNGAPYGNAPKIIASDENSFTVEVTGVGDAISGISTVKFPVWTSHNGQDDLKWYIGTNHGNGRWTYTVNRKDHNNELGEYITHAYAYDATWAGNSKNLGEVRHSFVDSTAPTVTHTISPSDWTNGSVTINVTAKDSYSGLKNITLPNGSTTTSGTASYTVTSNGTYTFKATDNSGNVNTYNVKVTNIDKDAPNITISKNPNKEWSNTNVTANVTFSDSLSGLDFTAITKKGPNDSSASAVSGTSVVFSENGVNTIYTKAYDNAGNLANKQEDIKIDKIAPTLSLSLASTAWTNGSVTINVSASDTLSGVNIKKWASGNQSASYFASKGTTFSSNSFSVSSNGTYTVYVKDNAGNETVKTITVSNIDKTAPTITLSQNPTSWTNGSVSITAAITETDSGVSVKKWAAGNQTASYFTSSGTTITGNSFTVAANGTYTFYAKDAVGNVSVKTINITNIDKTAPTIALSQSPTTWTNGNVTVTANITESDSGINTRKWASGSQNVSYFNSNGTTISGNTFTVSGNGTYTFYAKDNAGNASVKTITISNIDKTAPTITLSQNPTAWTNGNVTITANITERDSGVNTRKWASGNQNASYFANNGTTITSNSFTVTTNGTYTFYVKDNAGNTSVKTINITNIDKTAPTITLSQNPTSWTNGSVSITAAITETDSGVSVKKWASGNQNASYFANNGTTITSNSFTVTTNGTYTFYVKDNAGNTSVKTINITNIDKTAPTITLSQNPTAWTNGSVTVTANITEKESGINTRKWAPGSQNVSYFNSSGTTITSNSFTVTTNGTYTFYAKDNAGNASVKTITISNIDKTAPTITLSQNPTAWTNGNVTITATIVENESGINTRKWASGNQNTNYFANNGTTITSNSFTVTTNGTYTFYAKDNAGNASVKTITISNIDKTAPTITLSQNPTAWTNGNVTITATIIENESGINTRKWASGNQNTNYFASNGTTITSNSFTVSSNGAYTFYVKDNAGNESVKTINITNIDKTAPTIKLSQNPTAWTNGNVTITANITENESGISIKKWASGNQNASYFVSNGTTITSNSFTVTTNGTYTFYVKDVAGNESIKTINISNIDKIASTITLSQNPTAWTNGNVTITATIIENESGINTRKWASGNQNASYFANNGTTITSNSFTVTTNGTYTFYVKDVAGNESVKTINITNIDKTAPTITLSQNPTAWTNGNVTITANITENESGISVKKWASGNQSASYFASNGTTITSNSFTVSSNGTYTFYVKDVAGNTSVKTITISNIDKIASTISGTFDYPWVKGTRTISFTSNDDESGIASLKLWDNDKTKVLKEGTVNGKTASLSHVITEEGITKYKIESIDIANNVTTKNVTVRIDNTAPEGIISMPTVSDDKTITILLSNLLDTYSGLKEAIISENASFSDSNVVKVSLSDVESIDDVRSTEFTLTGKSTFEENFTTRNVYVRLIDNVGNYKDYTFGVLLVPKKPSIPIILTPEEDQLYTTKETVLLTWSYDSIDEDVGYLPQQKAEIELTHIESGLTKTLVVEGEIFNKELTDLDNGGYEVRVRVYNFDNVYEDSEVRTFRINKFKDSGNVLTIDITPGSPIKYVSILTESEIPNGTSIEGKLYYSEKSNGDMDISKYINFTLTNNHTFSNIITLPKTTGKLRIEYILKGSKVNDTISPILDNLIVLGK